MSGGPDVGTDEGGSVMGPIIIGRSLLLLLQLLESPTYNDDESEAANGEDGNNAGNGLGRSTVVEHTAPLLVTPLGASSGSVKPGTATTTPKKNNPTL